MTSVRQAVRRLLGGASRQQEGDHPDVLLAYTFYWTKQARSWDDQRRALVKLAVGGLIGSEGFVPNPSLRRYQVPGLDESAHAGASLVALLRVLEAFEQFEDQAETGP